MDALFPGIFYAILLLAECPPVCEPMSHCVALCGWVDSAMKAGKSCIPSTPSYLKPMAVKQTIPYNHGIFFITITLSQMDSPN